MSDESVPCSDPIWFTDGATVGVGSADGFVHLVTRDAHGLLVSGAELTPSEAQQLGESLLTAAFVANLDAASGG